MTVDQPLSSTMTSLVDPCMAAVLSDLNMFYIRQIGASLKKHVGLQDRLEREMKIRDGATRLMAACTHETQLLEAAKTLHTSNARTLSYMAELQKMKAAEVMEAIMDEPGFSDESKVCKGRIAISDIRVPLIWKEMFPNKNKDHNRHAVFCLLSVGSEVQDTELVCVNKTTTDISFSDIIVFENALYDFKMVLEIFAYPMSNCSVSAPTPQKLMSRLNRSIGKGEGKRIRERMKENSTHGNNGSCSGPLYEKIGSLVLTLGDVSDAVRSRDLDRTNERYLSLPLYESITCRLVAQPKCVTDISMSGFLHSMEMVGAVPNWNYTWCEVKGGSIKGWKNPEDTSKDATFTIDLIPKDVKISEIEKLRQRRAYSFQIRDTTDRHLFAADDKESMVKWIRSLRQHKSDYGAWGIACNSASADRAPMFIASPSPKKGPSDLIFDAGVRKTLVYDQLGIDSPLKAMTEAIKCSDMLNDKSAEQDKLATASVHTVLLENQTTAPWAGFFTRNTAKPSKITRQTNLQHKEPEDVDSKHNYSLRPTTLQLGGDLSRDRGEKSRTSGSKFTRQKPFTSCSEASGSDDAFLSDVEETGRRRRSQRQLSTTKKSPASNATKKKRRAPLSPWDETANNRVDNNPPPKPPLPKLPPKQKSVKDKKRPSFSSASSLEGILEDRQDRRSVDLGLPRLRSHIISDSCNKPVKQDHAHLNSLESLRTQRLSQSSGYKSETESSVCSRVSERVWATQKNCVMTLSDAVPTSVETSTKSLHTFERSQSLDTEGFDELSSIAPSSSGPNLSPSFNVEVICAEPEEHRPRTNTMPKASPSRLRSRMVSNQGQAGLSIKPTPTPRRSYLTAVESTKVGSVKEHIYASPIITKPDDNQQEDSAQCTYRQLHYDPKANAFRQAKPPPLPPKTIKKSKKPLTTHDNQNEEPVYAQVDKVKKQNDRLSKSKADAYAKAHRAVIDVCKQRMQKEFSKEEESTICLQREVANRV